jgi:membrane associated rhomboid family serine protease
MFVPIGTDRPTRRRPRVVEGLIILNMLIYLVGLVGELVGIGSLEALMDWLSLSRGDFHVVNLITYQFGHSPSDILHLLFNMLGLWIFGVALNDRLGHLSFLGFYLIGGAVAGIAHLMDSPAPVIGASGSVCALIGGFIALFPRSRIRVLVLFFIIGIVEIGSLWVVGFYVLIDLIGWVGPSGSAVAYVAHLSGYLYGFLLAILLLGTRLLPSDDFDVLFLMRQKKRRTEWKRVVRQTEPTSVAGAISSSDPKLVKELAEVRQALQTAMRTQDWTSAAVAWMKLADTDEHACLSEQQQLELANRLFAAEHRIEAASAYARYLLRYSGTVQASEVQLMLGLLYVRHLDRAEDARPLLLNAVNDVREDGQRELARQLLAELDQEDAT